MSAVLIPLEDLENRAARVGLDGIPTAVRNQQRLTPGDGLRMYQSNDITLLGMLANEVAEAKHGKKTFYNVNVHVNYTNWCNKFCTFCAFQRRPKDDGAYCMTPEQVHEAIASSNPEATEVHMVAGVWPALPYEYYLDILRAAKAARPDIHVKAFTMVEIDQIFKLSAKPLQDVLHELREAGLDSLPGGGAEIFSDRLQAELWPKKMPSSRWLELAKDLHQAGFRTNCTMLYGMTETLKERVEHLRLLRELQDETDGFQTFVPLAFHPENTGLAHLPFPSPQERLRSIAIGRLFLDNIPHIKAYWVMLGLSVAQAALVHGANDFDGTVSTERIYHDAGADTPQELDRAAIHQILREAGRIPVERNTLYQSLREFSEPDPGTSAAAPVMV